jgi:hypothetical protein
LWHTAAMRSLHWPGLHRGLRQAPAALAVTGCLILAACGGSPAAKPSPKPTASATATAEPVSGAAAVAAITANWKTVFDGKAPLSGRLALVQDGPQLTAFIEAQAKTSFGQAAMGSTATVSSVIVSSPSSATVHWELLLLGTPILKDQVGSAVYLDGVWKVSIASFCGLAYLEFPQGSPKLPAACRG